MLCRFFSTESIDKSPVRPTSSTEKRKYRDTSSEEEDELVHTFQDNLDDYNSDEDADYRPVSITMINTNTSNLKL